MKPPDNAELFETPLSTHWFDESGILCAISKSGPRKLEYYEQVVELYKRFAKKGNKLCLLVDFPGSVPMSKEAVNYIAEENMKYLKAMAIVTNTPFGSGQTSAFLKHTFSNFPVMIFSCEAEAMKWLKEYL